MEFNILIFYQIEGAKYLINLCEKHFAKVYADYLI